MDELEATILEMVAEDPNGVTTERICRFTHKTPQQLGDVFEAMLAQHKILGFAGVWMSFAGFETASVRLIQALSELHAAAPTEAEIEPSRAVAAAGLKWQGKSLDRRLSRLAAAGAIQIHPNGICLQAFQLELTPRQRALLDRVIERLEKEPVNTPSPQQLAQFLGIPRQAVEEILRLGIRSGEILQLANVVFYTPRQFETLKAKVESLTEGKPLSKTELRDALRTTRKYVEAYVEETREKSGGA